MSLHDLAARLGSIVSGPDKLEERMIDPSVRIDDHTHLPWVPDVALRNGNSDHCGTNIFSLIHRDGRWLINAVTDNSRPCRVE